MPRMNLFGIQVNTKKWHFLTGSLGTWNGAVMHTDTPVPIQSTIIKK